MKLPWDKNYFKLSFYGVFSAGLFYVIKITIDVFAASLRDIDKITGAVKMLLRDFASVFSPLIMALIISYLLDPVVDFFQNKFDSMPESLKWGKKFFKEFKKNNSQHIQNSSQDRRTAGTVLTYCAIILIVCILSLWITGFEPGDLVGKINGVVNQLNDMLVLIQLKLIEWNLGEGTIAYVNSLVERLGKAVLSSESEIVRGITTVGRFLGNFFIALVAAFYLLQKKESLINKTDEAARILLNGKIYKRLLDIWRDLNMVFSNYIRAQMTDAAIMSILIGGGLTVIGVDFALIIGVLTGFTNLVPFLGAITGFTLSVIVALMSGAPVKALYAAIFVIIIQQIDSMYIVPKIVGKKVSLSPAAVILAVTIGGKAAGFLGMVLAVPVCSVAKLWFVRFLQKRKNKRERAMVHYSI